MAVLSQAVSTNGGRGRRRKRRVKEKRMWPTVKDDWRGVELSV